MKFLSKITVAVLAVGLVFGLSSCKDDDDSCTTCDAITIAGYEFPETTICVGDDDGAGGTYTQEQIDSEVAAFELLGGNCD